MPQAESADTPGTMWVVATDGDLGAAEAIRAVFEHGVAPGTLRPLTMQQAPEVACDPGDD